MFLQKTRALEKETERYIGKFVKVALLFEEFTKAYFSNDMETFKRYIKESDKLETQIDHIRKDIELDLYSKMLIPESRGDVFRILESLDNVADRVESLILEYDIERPEFPKSAIADMLKLGELSRSCIESLVLAVTSFFTGTDGTSAYIQEVKFYESEVDRYEEALKRRVFNGGEVRGLSKKQQLKYFVERTCDISDFSEEVCEVLALSIVKRSI